MGCFVGDTPHQVPNIAPTPGIPARLPALSCAEQPVTMTRVSGLIRNAFRMAWRLFLSACSVTEHVLMMVIPAPAEAPTL